MFARAHRIWRALTRRTTWENELEEELRSHVERRVEDLVRAGVARDESVRRARMELGGRESYKEQCREAHGLRWPDEVRQDLWYAARTLRRSLGFTVVAALSLALGIGANTVVFSVIRALVLKPLPVPSPNELYFIQASNYPSLSFPNYRDIRDRNTTFSGFVAYRMAPMGLDTGGGAYRIWGYLATGNYFDVLDVLPSKGRFFHAEDDRQPNASPYAVLSYACWQNRFASDPNIVGRTIHINSLPYTVLGVAPAGFRGTELFYVPEIWVPMMMQPQIEGHSWLDRRGDSNSWVIGRVKPGMTVQQAESNLNALATVLAKEFPESNEGLRLSLARPGLVGNMGRAPAEALLGGVMILAALVLVAACANLASLAGARAADRYREIAIRLSIGAGRARILRQLLTESILLSLIGGAAGCGLAVVFLRLLSAWRAPLDFPLQVEVTPDGRVFAFALFVSLVTGVLFSIAPARQVWDANPNEALKGMPSGMGKRRRWAFRDFLLTAQVALCCVLVTGCFVSLRGLARALATPTGFQGRGVSVIGFDLALVRYNQEDGQSFQRHALEAVAQLPGVTDAAYASSIPLSLDHSSTTVFPEGAVDFRDFKGIGANYYDVSPGYFHTMGTRLVAGREFTWHDDARAQKVAIVNETFARKVAGARDAVGRRFLYGRDEPPIEIVGVVEDGRYVTLAEDPTPVLFRPAPQSYNATTVLAVRSSLPEGLMAAEMRRTIAALDTRLPVYGVGSLMQMLGEAFLPARAATIALSAFGLLAVMLAVTGIYGLAAYSVSRRVREIGIRIAVGAQPWHVLQFVLGRTSLLLSIGLCVGLALSLAASQLLSSIVYQASSRDPLVLLAAALAMVLIGLGAACAPARRALSIDPLRALRHE